MYNVIETKSLTMTARESQNTSQEQQNYKTKEKLFLQKMQRNLSNVHNILFRDNILFACQQTSITSILQIKFPA